VNPFPDSSDVLARVAAGSPLPGESATRDADGNLISFTQSFQNTGTQKVRGADFGLVYQLQTSFGTWTSNAQATFLDSYQFSSTPGGRERELRSSPINDFSDDAYLKWKGVSRLHWAWQGFGAAATARYRDGFHEFDVNGNEHWVKQTWFFDLQASYEFRVAGKQERGPRAGIVNGWPTWRRVLDRTTVTVGCTNIFDHDPPRSNDNFSRFIYDPTGRFVYVSVTKKF